MPNIERVFDIVVIGSGAGGGTVAHELAPLVADGLSVLVLEAGARLRPDEITNDEVEMANRLYEEGGGFLTRDGTMSLAFAKAYGGSTTVYTGTSLAVARRTLEKWRVPGLDASDIERRCERYVDRAELFPAEELNDNNLLFRHGCQELGWHVEQFRVNVKKCKGCGLCNLGCYHGAKQGTNVVQLPAAERKGVVVITNARVDRIGDRMVEVTVSEPAVGEPSAWRPGPYRIRARAIVLAAGAVGTPALMLRSKLPARLPELGRWFTCHPALVIVGQHEQPISNFRGHPKSFYSAEFAAKERFLLESCMYFPFTTARNLVGIGDPSKFLEHMDRLQMVLALALDEAERDNRVTVDGSGKPVVDYRLSPRTLDALFHAQNASAKLLFASGARRVHAPAGRAFAIENFEAPYLEDLVDRELMKPGRVTISAAHLMGGARMGLDRSDSVTNAWGQVHGLPWLFVADASLFPGAAEINPCVTVMALAERVAERVRSSVRDLELVP